VTQAAKGRLVESLSELAGSLQRSGTGNPIALLNLADILASDLQHKKAPEAYMLYALYDADSNRYEVGKQVLTKNAANQHEILEENLYISQDGYMETFVVNETAEDVWFDNFMVMSTTSLVVQETHYDPWGLELTGLGFQAGGLNENRYLYNGKELIEDNGLQYYDYGQRMYDPALGRFNRIDRFSEKYGSLSPYQYGANNPILYIDVNGDSIMISHRAERIVYQDGNLTWAGTGQTYDGKAINKKGNLKGFVGQSVKALNAIRTGGKSGNELISNLQNDSHYAKISKGNNSATGISVAWDPNSTSGGLDESGGTSRPAFIGLAHELAHAWDLLEDGKQDQSEWFIAPNGQVKPKVEQYASHWENLIRAENGLNLRTHYATTPYEPSRLVNGVSSLHQSQQHNFSFPITGSGRANLYYPKSRINIMVLSPYKYR